MAEDKGKVVGYALAVYPQRSKLARLYSIAVAPHHWQAAALGRCLLAAAEEAAKRRGRRAMRLEVHEHNPASHCAL